MIDPKEFINFNGPEWNVLRIYLKEMQDRKTAMLIAENSHDESNKIRGAIIVIRELLRLETAAKGPQKEAP